jgi:predicted phosphodiesterase
MPSFIPERKRLVFPVLGTSLLEKQIREIGSDMHIYGHSHVNRQAMLDGITYVNNAFGYPHESRITSKKLLCVYDCESKTALKVTDSIGARAN